MPLKRCYLIMVVSYLSQLGHNQSMHPYLLDPPYLRQQPDLFDPERWPRRPYCTDGFDEGVRIRSLKQALTKAYIQVNPPHLRVWSIYDIDRPGGSLAWEDANLPPPSWITSNRQNRHAHIVYGLSAPVLVNSMEAKQAPLRFLNAIEQSFRAKLGADDGYSGLITKNPVHPLWETFQGRVLGYNLHDLANCIEDLDRYKADPGVKVAEVGLGRNVTVFDFVRLWSYKKVRDFKHTQGGFVYWQKAVLDRCGARNADFSRPMDSREIYQIAKSVAKWTWQRFDIEASDARFSKLQSFRGKQQSNFMGAIHDSH